jgi:SAM-dependent methyltransferase
MRAFMLPRDVALFLHSARTDARIQRLKISLGSTAAALEAVYAEDPDPWSSASSSYRYQTRKYEVLASLIPTGPYERVLDLGCGQGLLTRRLTAHAGEVVGIDVSESAIRQARRINADKPNARFQTLDLLDLPVEIDGTFDLVVAADVLYYLSPLDRSALDGIVNRIAALLKPGGTCLLANHYFFRFDPDSRRSRTIHDAFNGSDLFLERFEAWRPFYLATLLGRTDRAAPR